MVSSTPRMDVLGDVLLSLRLLSSRIGVLDFAVPWGIAANGLPPHTAMAFTVVEGAMSMEVGDGPPARLKQWDTVLLMDADGHRMTSSPEVEAIELADFVEARGLRYLSIKEPHADPLEICWGEGSERTRLLLIALIAQDAGPSAILSQMPRMIVLRSSGSPPVWLDGALQFLGTDSRTAPGYVATASRYVELIFTSILRAYLLTEGADGPRWMRGLRDPRLGRAISAIHTNPGADWTVDGLAREAGMSRSTFARHFADLIGQSPIDYLITHRMQLAYGRLAGDGQRVSAVAEALGYRSERAFREAFKSRFGQSPTRYVRQKGR